MVNRLIAQNGRLRLALAGVFVAAALSGIAQPVSARSRAQVSAPPSASGEQSRQPEQQAAPNGEQSQIAQQPTQAALVELVRVAVQNEIVDTGEGHLFAWKERKKTPHGTIVQRIVQTPQGVVNRIVLVNDKPLNAEQQRSEEERISRSTDPGQMRRKQKEDHDDDVRTSKMLRAIPEAFEFTHVKTETAANGHTLVTMKFAPRPGFAPPSRETMVFTGMDGDLVVDQSAKRLAKVDGTLFQDVNFGWGIFGRLYRGGRFVVEKAEVAPNHWDTTRMVLQFRGKILMFKSLHIDEDETSFDFQPVQPMTVAQALEYLNRPDQAQNAMTRKRSAESNN